MYIETKSNGGKKERRRGESREQRKTRDEMKNEKLIHTHTSSEIIWIRSFTLPAKRVKMRKYTATAYRLTLSCNSSPLLAPLHFYFICVYLISILVFFCSLHIFAIFAGSKISAALSQANRSCHPTWYAEKWKVFPHYVNKQTSRSKRVTMSLLRFARNKETSGECHSLWLR